MNRNLKRVLSLALTLVVMAVNFVIPAMAATSITVSYTDLLNYGSLLQRQGELYYETTPGNANANSGVDSAVNKNRVYAPLEVWSVTNNAGLQILAKEWVRFEVEVGTAGYYSVDMNAAVGAASGTYVYIRTEKSIIEKALARTGTQYAYTDINDIGYVYFDEGTNYIYVDNKGGSYINFRSLSLTLDESADATMVKWLAPVESANEITDYTVSYTDGYNQAEVSTVTFDMDIPMDGKYQVSVMGMTYHEHDVFVDFGGDAKTATVDNYEYAYTELGVFALTEDSYIMTLGDFGGYSLAWAKLEYVGPYGTAVERESFSDGDTVVRGTDNLTITFNDNMMDTATATLTATADGTKLPVAVDADGANIIVSFLETLAYETEYILEVTGLQGVNDGAALDGRTYTFTTGDDSSDEGVDDVEITDVASSREDATIKGIVKGSTGYGIKGRIVTVTDDDGTEVASVTSGDDGAFSADFIIDETVVGTYTYTVTAEYGASESVEVIYVSEAEELRILDLFEAATTPDAVYDIFEAYGEVLLIPNYEDDCAALANDDLFLAHFAGQAFTAISEVAPFYNKMLLLEQLNQASLGSYVYSNFFSKPEVLSLLFEEEVIAKILALDDSEKQGVANEFVNIVNEDGYCTSKEALFQRIEGILDDYFGGGDVVFNCADVYYELPVSMGGSFAIIPVNISHYLRNISEITLTLTASDPAIFSNMFYTTTPRNSDDFGDVYWEGGEPEKQRFSIKGKTATLDASLDATAEGTFYGYLVLEPSVAKEYSLTLQAVLTRKYSETYIEQIPVAAREIILDSTYVYGSYNESNCNMDWDLTAEGILTIYGDGYTQLGTDYSRYAMPYDGYKIGIKEIHLYGVVQIGYGAFQNYPALEKVVIDGWSMGAPLTISIAAFYHCPNLIAVDLPDNVSTIGEGAFEYCSKLTAINLPDTVESIGQRAFYCCSSLTDIHIPERITKILAGTFYECNSLKEIEIPDGVTIIDSLAFSRCFNLEKVNLPVGLKTIGNNAFTGCKISELLIPDTVTSIGTYAFSICENLEYAVIGSGVSTMGQAIFVGCDKLNTIVIKKGVTEIEDYAFGGTSGLVRITIPDSVTRIGDGAFSKFEEFACDNLKSIVIPDSVTEIGYRAFDGCSGLESVDLGNGIINLTDWVFAGCGSLKQIVIPATVEVIGYHVFDGCESLQSISVTSNTTIIADGAFSGCNALTDVYFNGTEEEWNAIYIGEGNEALLNATIHFVARLTYDVNGGENAPETVNQNGEVLISDTIPTRFGYIFKGWSVDKIASMAQYQPGDTITLDGENIVLYAVWYPIEAGARVYDEELVVSIYNAPIGSQLVVACYDGTKLVHIDGATVTSETRYYFGVGDVTYDNIKVMLYEDFINMNPLMNPLEVPLS